MQTKHPRTWVPIIAGPALGLLIAAFGGEMSPSISEPAARAAGLLVWMAVWWITEAAPLAVTSLLPLVLLPAMGVLGLRESASPYADRIIFLFLGGFFLAIGLERWNLHRRIALIILRFVGTSPARLVAGIMLATGCISMWVNNTSTAMMMLPIALSLVAQHERARGAADPAFAACMMLGIAYAANIGGIATPIGTAPNIIMLGFLKERFGVEVGFLSWMLAAGPLAGMMLVASWVYLARIAHPVGTAALPGASEIIRKELRDLGPMSRGEWSVFLVFLGTVAAWISREPLASISPQGISAVLRERVDDSSIAIVAAVALFVIPVDRSRGIFVLDWSAATRVPWDVLLLFGGGLSLAAGVQSSGLDDVIAGAMSGFGAWPHAAQMLVFIAVAVFLSEVTSNTAQANLMMPVLAGVALAIGMDPVRLLVPCGMAFSLAFMMPMGTPPNAIVFASGRVTIRQMARTGFVVNLFAIAAVMLASYTLVPWFLPLVPGK